MKNKILNLIDKKIAEVTSECEPEYCGLEEYNEWVNTHYGKLELLEELKYEINKLN